MDPLTMAMMGGSVLSGLGGLFGSQQQARGAQGAGQMGAMGSMLAAIAAQQGVATAKEAMSPYTGAGSQSIGLLMKYLTGGAGAAGVGGGGPSLISTFAPTMAQLEKTPGYQWQLAQGTKAAQNAAAARGLGSSGNAIQGGVDYATGLASTTFQQQLQNYMAQNQQAYNMLYGPSALGQTAAGNVANAAMQGAQLTANALSGAGSSLGQGIMGQANAGATGMNALFGGVGSALSLPFMAQNFGRQPAIGQPATNYAGIPEALQFITGTGGSPFPYSYSGR